MSVPQPLSGQSAGDASGLLKLPASRDFEQAVLGCMVLDPPRIIPRMQQLLKEDSFAYLHNKVIFTSLCEMFSAGKDIDILLLTQHLVAREELERAGGPQVIAGLIDSIPTVEMAEPYAKELVQLYMRREMIRLGGEKVRSLYDPSTDLRQAIRAIIQGAEQLLEHSVSPDSAQHIKQLVLDAVDYIGERNTKPGLAGLSTGIDELDRRTGGIGESEMWVTKALPGVGKSAIGVQIATKVAMDGIPVLYFTPEMLGLRLALRMISSESGINNLKLRKGELQRGELTAILQNAEKLVGLPFYVDDRPGLTIDDIEAVTSRMVRQHNVKLIVVDYIQYLREGRSYDTRQRAIADMSGRIKGLCKTYSLGAIVLSQVNADGAAREARDIEQDADVLLAISREDPEDPENTGRVFALSKVRDGEPGRWEMEFQGNRLRFVEKKAF